MKESEKMIFAKKNTRTPLQQSLDTDRSRTPFRTGADDSYGLDFEAPAETKKPLFKQSNHGAHNAPIDLRAGWTRA